MPISTEPVSFIFSMAARTAPVPPAVSALMVSSRSASVDHRSIVIVTAAVFIGAPSGCTLAVALKTSFPMSGGGATAMGASEAGLPAANAAQAARAQSMSTRTGLRTMVILLGETDRPPLIRRLLPAC